MVCPQGSGQFWSFPLSDYQLLQPNNSKQHEMRISRSMGDIMGSLYKDSERTRKYSTGQWGTGVLGCFSLATTLFLLFCHNPVGVTVWMATLMSPTVTQCSCCSFSAWGRETLQVGRGFAKQSHSEHRSEENRETWGVIWGWEIQW